MTDIEVMGKFWGNSLGKLAADEERNPVFSLGVRHRVSSKDFGAADAMFTRVVC
ncbi:hypothetical protein Oscil6304_2543 [Oscillatoria acuminata PCC 6304]|uniref:Uncharacterized protein n=1 Tax=Oscillatoria acuminata PCC 6304 TaxID=56110 RepID=K9TJ27_9CYAN|nr:hypothetical protein Oscil6304_2543 [Oscillatoria acuminata PCC 6304]